MDMRLLIMIFILFVAGCARNRGGGSTNASDGMLPDSTYVYGYAEVGDCRLFEIRFEDSLNAKHFYYTRHWAGNGIPKDHMFVSAMEPGKWIIKYIEAGGCRIGGGRYVINKPILIDRGMGNYLGRFSILENPLPKLLEDASENIDGKAVVDRYMAEVYSDFNVAKTKYQRLGK